MPDPGIDHLHYSFFSLRKSNPYKKRRRLKKFNRRRVCGYFQMLLQGINFFQSP